MTSEFAVRVGSVLRGGAELGGHAGIGSERGAEGVGLIGINDDVEGAAFGQFERGVVIGGESVLRIEARFENSGGARVDVEGDFLFRRRAPASMGREPCGALPKLSVTLTGFGTRP